MSPRHAHPPRLSPKESRIVELPLRDSELYGLQLVAASRGRLKRGVRSVEHGRGAHGDEVRAMSRAGDRVRRAALRMCSERMRKRLIDPAVADLQEDVSTAHRTGSGWP